MRATLTSKHLLSNLLFRLLQIFGQTLEFLVIKQASINKPVTQKYMFPMVNLICCSNWNTEFCN